jgi:hypothetical protein
MSKTRTNKGVSMSLVIDALKAKYVAQRLEAMANLQTYLSAAVGVGEHPNIVAECDELIGKVSEAEGKLSTLTAIVDTAQPAQPQG